MIRGARSNEASNGMGQRRTPVCQLEAPHFDAERHELIYHVVLQRPSPPRSIVRVAAKAISNSPGASVGIAPRKCH